MPSSPASLLALSLVVLAALGLVACGGEDAKLLPGETAREITANLDTVQQLADEGDCVGAESAAQQVGEQVEALEGVDPKLKRALEEGADRLEEVIAGCEESSTEAIAPAEIPSEPEEEEKASRQREAREKEAQREEEAERKPSSPSQPQTEGEGENGNTPSTTERQPEEAQESPSGGLSPGAPAGEGE